MADFTTTANTPNGLRWDEKLVDFALGDPVRRRLFFVMIDGKPRAASQLSASVQRTLDATYKHLVKMRSKGLLVSKPDKNDDRRSLFQLAPWISIKDTPDGKVLDCGFIEVNVGLKWRGLSRMLK